MIIIANLKMNLDYNQAIDYVQKLEQASSKNQIVVCPAALYIPLFKQYSHIVGAQNCYFEDRGAYTGEISPLQLKTMGVSCVIVGHSERRGYFNEDDVMVNKKCLAVLRHGMTPILCVGETREEKAKGETVAVLERQLTIGLKDVEEVNKVMIAYEPRWAIGTGMTPTVSEIEQAITYIKNKLGPEVKVIYGGSVDTTNMAAIGEIKNVDGMLVGTASVDAINFMEMIKLV